MILADGVEHDVGEFISCWCRGECSVGGGPAQARM